MENESERETWHKLVLSFTWNMNWMDKLIALNDVIGIDQTDQLDGLHT